MKTKHSAGPWKHVPGKDGESFMSFEDANGNTVVGGCGCCMSPYGCSSEAGHTFYKPNAKDRANAALIEAAPDLLSALMELMGVCDHWSQTAEAHGMADAAVAKAMGEANV